ncbi:GCVP / pyridoxal phosphate containing glycine decarboxylase [Leishmania donovani]|uniref:Glycine cleavage system P protein n=1 Tax=Leishmania donovani TaxID=5661 RepID=A0A504XTT9_LEIDO|nr:glycine dehydrogenase [Leishmania donovani]CAJ1989589.1 GCVP / pyridoxal phosphate containing glycine decarboxylase [Leishmania donovani]VDZ45455.1 pyridoxal_phosphate_containing_glycine_decarboxylase_putative/GeneDB:LmjF.26.0030 [Leishmania donovani]
MLRRLLRVNGAPAPSRLARYTSTDAYLNRHIGPTRKETVEMLKTVGKESLAELMTTVLPSDILRTPLNNFKCLSETEALSYLKSLGAQNKVLKSMIGQGYYECIIPSTIMRNVLENPMWYTPYTPFQSEIAQGRLESLLNFQTMVTDLTKMDISNASLLDQATAAGECMYLALNHHRHKRMKFFVSKGVFLSSIEMIRTRAHPLGAQVIVGDVQSLDLDDAELSGIFVQTPDAKGELHDFTTLFARAKANGVVCCAGVDLMASCLVKTAGEMGADVVVGCAQRFGTPLGYGGPHAAFMAITDNLKRLSPGRIVGISKDNAGDPAIRMALQTREQHIKRERATSNICTAQALLANMNAFYAIYHGPEGLKQLAREIHQKAKLFAVGMESLGFSPVNTTYFDTLSFSMEASSMTAADYAQRCVERGINIFVDGSTNEVSISVDEATTENHIAALLQAAGMPTPKIDALTRVADTICVIPAALLRKSKFMQSSVFNSHKSETELMRYIQRLQRKDYGLTHGMIPLGSCTMKLNSAAAMRALSWPEYNALHPYAPEDQARGYHALLVDLKQKLCDITGMAACSIQPNSGAQGEYAGLRIIRAYHESRGEGHRDVCFIPTSAHGTNPASAVLAGLKVVTVKCLDDGSVDMVDLEAKCVKHAKDLACLMITYPSTYGLYDKDIRKITSVVHEHGGQCYIDGANLNALVGYTGPGFIGGDVCHINMHKTFSIPHGGGGPGLGPITVRQHLAPFLPNSTYGPAVGGSQAFGQVSQAGNGSASIATISYALIMMLGSHGLKTCTEYAVLNANYLKKRLEEHYTICFLGHSEFCAHEFILDIRPFKKTANIDAEDVAKRLMDYGFHAPTLAFPVAGTLMIEPTECESKRELDRLADALISIRREIAAVERGDQPKNNNVLTNAPHTAKCVTADEWNRPYSRQLAAYPTRHQYREKFWPSVGRVDNTYGDLNLMCSCAPLEFYH